MEKNFVNSGTFKTLSWLTVLICTALLISSFTWLKPKEVVIDFPSASEIADAIIVPETAAGPTAQEIADLIEVPSLENKKIGDIHQVLFGECNREIKEQAEEDVLDEVDEDDIEEFLEDEIEDFDVLVSISLREDETEIEVIEVGECEIFGTEFDSDEDKEAIVTLEYKIKYKLKEGEATKYKGTLIITGTVRYDKEDLGDIEDIDLVYSL